MSSSPAGPERTRSAVVIWVLAALIAASARPWRSLDIRGIGLVLVHCADVIGALVLLTLCAALGTKVLVRLRTAFSSPGHIAFATAIGAGILATELLVIAALAGPRAWLIGLLLLANAISAGPELARLLWNCRVTSGGGDSYEKVSRAAMLALTVVTAIMITLAFPPPSDGDSLMYHLPVPLRWLQDGKLSTLSGNAHVGLVGLAHMLYLPLLAIGSVSGPAIVSVALAVLVGIATYGLTRRLLREDVATYATILLWGTPTILLVGASPRVDVTLSLFLILAHYAVLEAWLDGTREHLDLGAMLTGMALGVKFQAGAYAIALMPIVGIIGVERGNIRKAFASMTRFGLLCLVSAAPWLLKNLILFGAPFYPLFVPHRIEPWVASLLPAGTSSPALDPRVWQIQQSARSAFNLRDAFVHPGALSVGGEGAFYFLNPILVLLPLGLLWVRNPRLVALAGPPLLYVAIVIGVAPETNPRYLIPGLVGLTITCSYILLEATSRLPDAARRAIRALAVLVSLVPTAGSMVVWVGGTHPLLNLLGLRSGAQYLAGHVSPVVRSEAALIKGANPLLTSGDTVLMIYEVARAVSSGAVDRGYAVHQLARPIISLGIRTLS